MAKDKRKVILFIVEGYTDKRALESIIDELLPEDVEFEFFGGDITTKNTSNYSNILEKITRIIKKYLSESVIINKKNILEVIHLVDIDGIYADESTIIVDSDAEKFIYTEEGIIAKSKQAVIDRNKKKYIMLEKIIHVGKVYVDIPYKTYYFSCNMEHVLHNKINVPDDMKVKHAKEFEKRYEKREHEFIEFINDSKFAVEGDYTDTWDFIKQDNNSLKRYSNLHLFINDKTKKD